MAWEMSFVTRQKKISIWGKIKAAQPVHTAITDLTVVPRPYGHATKQDAKWQEKRKEKKSKALSESRETGDGSPDYTHVGVQLTPD